eukprot:365542-Chlamydomonas_euryale.AAC.22
MTSGRLVASGSAAPPAKTRARASAQTREAPSCCLQPGGCGCGTGRAPPLKGSAWVRAPAATTGWLPCLYPAQCCSWESAVLVTQVARQLAAACWQSWAEALQQACPPLLPTLPHLP